MACGIRRLGRANLSGFGIIHILARRRWRRIRLPTTTERARMPTIPAASDNVLDRWPWRQQNTRNARGNGNIALPVLRWRRLRRLWRLRRLRRALLQTGLQVLSSVLL